MAGLLYKIPLLPVGSAVEEEVSVELELSVDFGKDVVLGLVEVLGVDFSVELVVLKDEVGL